MNCKNKNQTDCTDGCVWQSYAGENGECHQSNTKKSSTEKFTTHIKEFKTDGGESSGKQIQASLDYNAGWRHPEAYGYIFDFSDNYFRAPDVLANVPGGIAIWYPKLSENFKIGGEEFPNVFSEHWARDEWVKHHCPATHHDFFYSFIKLKLDNSTNWKDVLAVSGSVSYDPLKGLLSARCGSIEANIATFYTCLQMLNGKIKIEDRPQAYGKNIKATRDEEKVKEFYRYIVQHLSENFVPTTGYWDVAFPQFKESGVCY